MKRFNLPVDPRVWRTLYRNTKKVLKVFWENPNPASRLICIMNLLCYGAYIGFAVWLIFWCMDILHGEHGRIMDCCLMLVLMWLFKAFGDAFTYLWADGNLDEATGKR